MGGRKSKSWGSSWKGQSFGGFKNQGGTWKEGKHQGKRQAPPEFQSWVGALLCGSGLCAGDDLMHKAEFTMQSQIPPKMNGLPDLKYTIILSFFHSFIHRTRLD